MMKLGNHLVHLVWQVRTTMKLEKRCANLVQKDGILTFPFLLFTAATRSLTIGLVLGSAGALSNLIALANPNYMDPKNALLLKIMHENTAKFESAIKGIIISTMIVRRNHFFG